MSDLTRFKFARLLPLVLILSLIGLGFYVLLRKASLTFTFTPEELQQRVAEKFPTEQKLGFASVVFSNPVVSLSDSSDRIGIGLDMTIELASDRRINGKLAGDWRVRYESTKGALYLEDVNISKFDIDGMPASTREGILKVAQPVLRGYLQRVPVHTFRQRIDHGALKSVLVKDGKLVVTIGRN